MILGMADTDLLAPGSVTHIPGVYDPASAALAVRAGHRVVYLSGEAIAATMLGAPSATSATQIADRAAVLAPFLGGVPLLADASTGFDAPDDSVWTALAYQRAGVSGIVLGDGSALRVQALATRVPDMLLIASARGDTLGEVIARSRDLAAAGASAVLPLGISETDLRSLHAALPGVRLVLSRTESAPGGRGLSDHELAAHGVSVVLHPLTGVLAALRAASVAFHALTDEKAVERVDLLPPTVLASVAGGAQAAFLASDDQRAVFATPASVGAAPSGPAFGSPAFGASDDRPWAAASTSAPSPGAAVSPPGDLAQPGRRQRPGSASGGPRPGSAAGSASGGPRPGSATGSASGGPRAADRSWADLAREIDRLGT
jgi:2-methylisocitrate lyase-like PEP mutase family enzyme